MGTLKDEVYDNLDYLSRLTEVVIAPQNEILATLPERTPLTMELLSTFKSQAWGHLGASIAIYRRTAVAWLLEASSAGGAQRQLYLEDFETCFSFEVSPDLQLDFVRKTMRGTVYLVKTKASFDDRELLVKGVNRAEKLLQNGKHNWCTTKMRDRTITVLNTFDKGSGALWATKNDSHRYSCCQAITEALRSAIVENRWRVRDTRLLLKMVLWIDEYLSDPNKDGVNAGLINLMKMRLMVDRDVPIYSLDEVKLGAS